LGTPSACDLAWAAGFFDGEGSVSIPLVHPKTRGKAYRQMQLQVTCTNTYPQALKRFQEWFGGRVTTVHRGAKDHPRKPCYKWAMEANGAASFLNAVRPYLKVKHEQADLALRFQSTMTSRNTVTLEQVAERAGVHVTTACNYLRGLRKGNAATVLRLQQAVAALGWTSASAHRSDATWEERLRIRSEITRLNQQSHALL